jgi:DNA helicase-2/ATP-dependent DNA helicase PcrA
MSHWVDLRKRARDKSKVLREAANGDSAADIVKAAEQTTKVKLVPCPPGDPLLAEAEAVLDSDSGIIWFNQDIPPALLAFYQLHEYAHHWLHPGRRNCQKKDFDAEASEEDAPFGVARVEGYGPNERIEREANIFALEVLLPSDVIRNWYLRQGLNGADIAKKVWLPETMVYHQLAYALLVSDLSTVPDDLGDEKAQPPLDKSQKEAAEWVESPLLVEAGPGTGKTRTLAGRIQFLLNNGIQPSSILALTFSNKAAEEMRSRIAIIAPTQAPDIWMGTFHAFGLELLRKHGTKIGLPSNPIILDPIDALLILEHNLPALNLDRYQNLYDPTLHLRSILAAISRAKDELAGPGDYADLARRMREAAKSEEEIDDAERAIEVARVYEFYQGYLDQEGMLDFGDLIYKAVTLLGSQAELREELRATYSHILIDEYQDVNRASGILLRELAGENKGLWVVGDTRQAIYRFRGASTANMRQFTVDFPAAEKKPLRHNYRSRPEILKVFSAFAPQMKATKGEAFIEWEPKRSPSGTVHLNVAEDFEAEVHGIAEEIKRHYESGIQYKDQAILCRSHASLARIAAHLERYGIPILYLGDLFERPEIRDLLALLSLASEGNGNGLVRVAGFPEYNVSVADVKSLLDFAREKNAYFPEALELANEAPEMSEKGRKIFNKIAHQLKGITFKSQAWMLLAQYLFNRSEYLNPLLEDQTISGQQKRLAIYQFFQFAHSQQIKKAAKTDEPKRHFLDHVRRIEIQGEEKQLRQVPDWASGINAVRLLTVHASKGLEFEVVYLPVLGQRYFPARKQSSVCPAPAGMLTENSENDHIEEEECLFFVALSRARETLCLSRANKYGDQSSNPSILLESVSACIPSSKHLRRQPGKPTRLSSPPGDGLIKSTFDAHELDAYIDCPRKYYYQHVLNLRGRRENSAYLQFHKCVYEVVRWIEDERSAGKTIDGDIAHIRLKDAWEKSGPRDHPYETLYLRDAEMMVSRVAQRAAADSVFIEPPLFKVKLENGEVQFKPDSVAKTVAGAIRSVCRIRTGRPSKTELTNDIYALYHVATEEAYGKNNPIEVMFLSTGEVQKISLKPQTITTRLKHYSDAITGIGQTHFPPDPKDRNCPRCSHYFICPAPIR